MNNNRNLGAHQEIESSFTNQISRLANDAVNSYNPRQFIGKVFGGFIALKVIHTTTKSVILKGEPSENNYSKTVAIKLTSPTHKVVSGPDHHSRQAHYMEKLKNPNMVVIHSAGTVDGVSYVVMEYLPNKDIVTYSRDMDENTKLKLFKDVCKGVIHMHNNLVTHSDLKPNNILVSSSGVPKIIDLELSLSTDNKFHEKFNFDNINGYTKAYASPEQMEGHEPNCLTDIYSLAVILVELLTGRTDNTEMYGLPKLRNMSKHRSNELSHIINKARAETPENRYQSVKEFTHDLEVFIENKKISHPYRSVAPLYYRGYRFAKNHIIVFSTIGCIMAIMTFFIFALTEQVNIAEESLLMLAKSHNLTYTESVGFDNKGEEILNSSTNNVFNHYDQLSVFGDAYYSQGKPEKAMNFYKKALGLYSDSMHEFHILTTVKIAKCYFAMNQYEKANILLLPYLPTIFIDNLNTPALIQMFFTIIEKNIRIDQWTYKGKDFKTPQQVSEDINLDVFTNSKERLDAEVSLHLLNATLRYYDMFGDIGSVNSFKNIDNYNANVLPNLLYSQQELLSAVSIIENDNHVTHLEPKIYVWLSRILSELGENEDSDYYYNLGVMKNIEIYGLRHPSTVNIYAIKYAISRQRSQAESLRSALKLYKAVEEINPNDIAYSAFFYEIVTEAYFISGDYKGIIRNAKETVKKFDELRQEQRNSVNIASTAQNLVWITGLDHIVKSHQISYYERALSLEKAYSSIYPTEASLPFIELQLIMQVGSLTEKIIAFEKSYKYIELFFNEETKPADLEIFTIAYQVQMLAQYCTELPNCNPIKYLNKADESIEWSPLQETNSAYRLMWIIKKTDVYMSVGDYKSAKQELDNNAQLIDNLAQQGNLFHAIIMLLRAEIQAHSGNNELAKQYIKISLVGIIEQFGTTSGIFQRAKNLDDKLTNGVVIK